MRSLHILVPFTVLLGVAPGRAAGPRPLESLHGAWRVIQKSLTSQDSTATDSSPQPGLVLFTERHYSLMYVEGNKPRTQFTDPARPTDAEKVEAYDTFVGHSGAYTVSDSMVAMQVVVSKAPYLMGTDLRSSFARFAYHIAKDTLRLTRRGPRGNFTMILVRVE